MKKINRYARENLHMDKNALQFQKQSHLLYKRNVVVRVAVGDFRTRRRIITGDFTYIPNIMALYNCFTENSPSTRRFGKANSAFRICDRNITVYSIKSQGLKKLNIDIHLTLIIQSIHCGARITQVNLNKAI